MCLGLSLVASGWQCYVVLMSQRGKTVCFWWFPGIEIDPTHQCFKLKDAQDIVRNGINNGTYSQTFIDKAVEELEGSQNVKVMGSRSSNTAVYADARLTTMCYIFPIFSSFPFTMDNTQLYCKAVFFSPFLLSPILVISTVDSVSSSCFPFLLFHYLMDYTQCSWGNHMSYHI